MKKIFKDKYVWITGASSGIGEALAYALAKQGANLILSALTEEELNPVKDICEETAASCMVNGFNLGKQDEIELVADKVLAELPRVDILINCGGISQRALTKETAVDVDRRIMEVNFFGSVILTKKVLPVMIKQGNGHIVALSSIAGIFGFPLRSAYSASKHAIRGFFNTLEVESRKDNVNVTTVFPGRVQTNISKYALDSSGTMHGKMDAGQANGITSEQCAKEILVAIRKKKKEVLIGGKELIMVYLWRYFPSLFHRIVDKIKPN